jgi:hypothetical protein
VVRSKAARGPEEAFILGAMISLVGSMAWVAWNPRILEGHFYRLPVMGLTHAGTLGWISMMIQGVLLRLTPMALGVEPRSRKLAFTTFGMWVVGGTGLVVHLGSGQWFGAWTAGLLLLGVALLPPRLHAGVFRRAREGDWTARYAAAAMIHLILAAGFGIFIALNKHLEWVAVSPFRMLGVHFHLAEVGWVTFMILGFGRKLLPILAPPPQREFWESPLRFAVLEGGLVVLVVALLAAPVLVGPASLVLLLGIVLHVYRPVGKLVRGDVRDRASFWASVACLSLLAGALLGAALGLGVTDRWGWSPDRALLAYGLLALLGWNLLSISAYAMKLFPLWVWEERFREDLGEKPVPAMTDLPSAPGREATGIGLAAGTALAAWGGATGSVLLMAWGLRLAAVGAFIFLFNFVRIARWGLLPLEFRPGPKDWERHRAFVEARRRAGVDPGPKPRGDMSP